MISELFKWQSIIEILVFAVVFYIVLNFLRGTRAAAVLKGFVFLVIIIFIGAMYAAEQLQLPHFKAMLQWILSGSFIALIVIFAPELRRGLTRLSQSPILSPLFHGTPSHIVDEVVNAAVRLSKNRIGMLVAIERDVGLGEYIEQGVRMNAEISRELLESIFYPGSALHDGAVVVQNNLIAAAGCLFPLTDDPAISKSMGTRHRAAIGISEVSDAIAVIVSEETGRISIAVGGKMTSDLNAETLEATLRELYTRADRPGLRFPRKNNGPENGPADGDGQPAVPPPAKPSPSTAIRKREKDRTERGGRTKKEGKTS